MLATPFGGLSQQSIVVKGRVISAETGAVPSGTLVVVKHKGIGAFADANGEFTLVLSRMDTLLVSARDHGVRSFTFLSEPKDTVFLEIKLYLPSGSLRPVIVRPQRPVSAIHRDLSVIRKELPEYPTGFDAIQSPLTALYSRFSKMERSKRLVAEWEYRDKKNALLKELFHLYVDADIIALSPEEFDDFIAFCSPSDYFLKTAREHELITYFQVQFRRYVNRYIQN